MPSFQDPLNDCNSLKLHFETYNLEPGYKDKCKIIYSEKGPWKFCIKLKSQNNLWISLTNEIKKYVNDKKFDCVSYNIVEGSPVICKSDMQSSFCRGITVDLELNGKIRVFMIDYGNTEEKDLSEVFQIPSTMMSIPALMTRCRLQGIVKSPNSQLKSNFEQLIKNRILDVTFGEQKSDFLTEVYLEIQKFSVRKILTNEYYSQPLIFSGMSVSISHFCEEDNIVYLHFSDLKQQLHKLHVKVQERGNEEKAIKSPFIGQPCLAYSDDNLWYRATVLKIEENETMFLKFIDYGYVKEVPVVNTVKILDYFLLTCLPAQTIACSLAGIEEKNLTKGQVMDFFGNLDFVVTITGEYNIVINGVKVVVPKVTLMDEEADRNMNQEFLAFLDKQTPTKTKKVFVRFSNTVSTSCEPEKSPIQHEQEQQNFTISNQVPPGCIKLCNVLDIESRNNFYVSLTEKDIELKALDEALRAQFSLARPIPNDKFVVGLLVCFESSTNPGTYLRGKVILCMLQVVKIFLIDYGKEQPIKKKELRYLPSEAGVQMFSAQAINCSVIETNNSSSCHDLEDLKSRIVKEKVKVHFVEKDGKKWKVDISNLADMCGIECDVVDLSTKKKTDIFSLNPQPSLVTGEKVFISFIDSDNNCFWIQIAQKMSDLEVMNELIESLVDYGEAVNNLNDGQLCLCQSVADSMWYRGRVVSFHDDKVQIHYIDYGSQELLPLSNIFKLSPKLTIESPFGYQCALVSNENIKSISEIDCDNEYFVKFHSENKGIQHISIFETMNDVTDGCLNVNKTLQKDMVGLSINNGAVFEKMPSTELGEATTVAKKLMPLTSNIDIMDSFPLLNVEQELVISHIDGDGAIWVQLLEYSTSLNNMMNLLDQQVNVSESFDYFEVGLFCAAQYSEDLGWYRAQIVSIDEELNHAKVFYIDYGNRESLPHDSIKRLPIECSHLSKQALKSYFYSKSAGTLIKGEKLQTLSYLSEAIVKSKLHKNLDTEFYELHDTLLDDSALDERLTSDLNEMKLQNGDNHSEEVTKINNELHLNVDVCVEQIIDGISSTDFLLTDVPIAHTVEVEVPGLEVSLNQPVKAKITYAEKDSSFWIQLVQYSQQFDQLMIKISDYIKGAEVRKISLTKLVTETLCICNYSENGEFCRAQVLELLSDGCAMIQFIDYGCTNIFKKEELMEIYELPREFRHLPAQALHCKVANTYQENGHDIQFIIHTLQTKIVIGCLVPDETKFIMFDIKVNGNDLSKIALESNAIDSVDMLEQELRCDSSLDCVDMEQIHHIESERIKDDPDEDFQLIRSKDDMIETTLTDNYMFTQMPDDDFDLKTGLVESVHLPSMNNSAVLEKDSLTNEIISVNETATFYSRLLSIETKPFCFWLQSGTQDSGANEKILSLIEKTERQGLKKLEDIEVGKFCLSYFCGELRRAKILICDQNNVTVWIRYIDIGQKCNVISQTLYECPSELSIVPCLAKRYFLTVNLKPEIIPKAVISLRRLCRKSRCVCIDVTSYIKSNLRPNDIQYLLIAFQNIGVVSHYLNKEFKETKLFKNEFSNSAKVQELVEVLHAVSKKL